MTHQEFQAKNEERKSLKVDGNEKKRGVRKETVYQLLSGIVAIESYLQIERVVSL